jgi:signal transduction histidine kinase
MKIQMTKQFKINYTTRLKCVVFLFLLMNTYVFSQVTQIEIQLKTAAHDSIRCKILNDFIQQSNDNAIQLQFNQQLEKIVQNNLNQIKVESPEQKKFLFYKAEMLLNYANYYQSLSPPNDSITLIYNKKCLAVQKQLNNEKGIADGYLNMAATHHYLNNFEEALDNYKQALKFFKEFKDSKSEAGCLNNIGLIYESQGKHPEALKYYYSSLKIKEKLKDKKGIANAYSNIGNIFWQQEKLDDALIKYKTALNNFKEVKDTLGIADVYTNIGIIYIDQKKYQSAIEYHNKALQIYEKVQNLSGMGTAYGNLASAYLYQGKAKTAKDIYLKALAIREKLGNKKSIAYSYLGLGMSELQLKNPTESKKHLQQALALSKELGLRTLIKSSYNNLAKADSALFNYKGAYEHYKMFISYRDSISNEESEKKSLQTVMQYEYEKKAAILKEQAKAEKKQQQFGYIVIIVLLLTVVVFAMVWFYYYKKKQKNEKIVRETKLALAVAEDERRRISADLHDDLGVGISTIGLLGNRISKQEKIENVKSDAHSIIENTKKVSEKLTEVIWELNSEHNNLEDLLLFIQKQGQQIFKETNIHFSMVIPLEIPTIILSINQRKQIYFVVKEAFHNIVKHAQASQVDCKVQIKETLRIKIIDNGNGFDVDKKLNQSNGEGLKNMKNRITKMNGTINIQSTSEGTQIELVFPVLTK